MGVVILFEFVGAIVVAGVLYVGLRHILGVGKDGKKRPARKGKPHPVPHEEPTTNRPVNLQDVARSVRDSRKPFDPGLSSAVESTINNQKKGQ